MYENKGLLWGFGVGLVWWSLIVEEIIFLAL